jgi:N-carbamoyl-L-amino-acid hydrolase
MAASGADAAMLAHARGVERIWAYLELHIEQGPVLESEGFDIGVVTGVVGLVHARVRLEGEANHAGTTPMTCRRDALAGAARILLALREEARSHANVVVTVGELSVEQGAFNIVPGRCTFSIDYRVLDPDAFARAETGIRDLVARLAGEEGLTATVEVLESDPPVRFDERLVDVLAEAVELEGASALRLPSGAGHDAMLIARHAPAAMLFVPSSGGISHSPREHTTPEHCELGAHVLARAVELLDREEFDL